MNLMKWADIPISELNILAFFPFVCYLKRNTHGQFSENLCHSFYTQSAILVHDTCPKIRGRMTQLIVALKDMT